MDHLESTNKSQYQLQIKLLFEHNEKNDSPRTPILFFNQSAQTWSHNNKDNNFPNNIADNKAYNWLVDINDEIMQRFEVCIEESGVCTDSESDINMFDSVGDSVSGKGVGCSSNSRVKAKEKKKSNIQFHVPMIRKPQEVYKIVVDNSNQSFEHVELKKSEDGQRFVHPLVFHGADRDIVWLQWDFGIYICNMFDTGQASKVLKMERYSLEHLL